MNSKLFLENSCAKIALEGQSSINNSYSSIQKEIQNMNESIRKEGSIQKRLEMYKELKQKVVLIRDKIKKDSSIGLDEVPTIIKSAIIPSILSAVFIAGGQSIMKDDKKTGIASIGTGIATGTLGNWASISDHTNKWKANKNNCLKVLDGLLEEYDNCINHYQHQLSIGVKTVSECEKNTNDSKMRKNLRKYRINKFVNSIQPVTYKYKDKNDAVEYMKKDLVAIVKRYVSLKEFKDLYKPWLYLIDIKIGDYGGADLFELVITEYQSGYDSGSKTLTEYQKENTEWYDELYDVGEAIIKKRYAPWVGEIWHSVNIGDGDEGCLYID